MAARLNNRHSDSVRKKIQVSQIITRLQKHVDGKVEMSNSQINAAKVLLDKSLASLSDVRLDTSVQGITFNLNTTGKVDK